MWEMMMVGTYKDVQGQWVYATKDENKSGKIADETVHNDPGALPCDIAIETSASWSDDPASSARVTNTATLDGEVKWEPDGPIDLPVAAVSTIQITGNSKYALELDGKIEKGTSSGLVDGTVAFKIDGNVIDSLTVFHREKNAPPKSSSTDDKNGQDMGNAIHAHRAPFKYTVVVSVSANSKRTGDASAVANGTIAGVKIAVSTKNS